MQEMLQEHLLNYLAFYFLKTKYLKRMELYQIFKIMDFQL